MRSNNHNHGRDRLDRYLRRSGADATPAPDDSGSKILKRADGLKLHLYRDGDNGELSGTFEIEGSFGPILKRIGMETEEGNDPHDPHDESEAAGLAFVRGLLAEFEKHKPEGRGRGGDGGSGDDDDGGAKIRLR